MAESKNTEVAFWNEQFNMCKELRRPFEEEWYMNYAMYRGKQWVVWDRTSAGNRLVEPTVAQNRVRITSNKIRVVARRETAKLTKQEPIWFVVPATTEPEDVAAARCSQGISEYILVTTNFKSQRREATFWCSITGNGYAKITCPGRNEDIVIEPVIPWHMYVPEIQTKDLQKQPYIMVVKGMDKDTIQKQYNLQLKAEDLSSGDFLEQRFFNALGMTNTQAKSVKDKVLVKEIWIRPGAMAKYPDGGFIVIAGEQIADKYYFTEEPLPEDTDPMQEIVVKAKPTNYPFRHNRLPFAKMGSIPTGGFYDTSVIVDLIPLQKERNRTRSQMIEAKNRTSNPKMAYQKGSLDPNKVTAQAGQMLPINPGYDYPKYIEGTSVSTAQSQEIEMLDRDMDDISSQFEVTRGSTPPGVEAASAIAYLQEENDTVLHYAVESIADFIQECGQQALMLAQQFWDETKTIKVVSKNSAQDATIWHITDIKNNTDLRIEPDSIAPVSRAAKQAFITGLMKDGIIPPEKGLRYLQMNETNRLYDELQVDSKQAQRENYEMAHQPPPKPVEATDPETGMPMGPDPATGQPAMVPGELKPMPINPYDDHNIHIYEHGLFLKSQEAELLPMENRLILVNHWQQHKQMMEYDIARAAGQPTNHPSEPSGPPNEQQSGEQPQPGAV